MKRFDALVVGTCTHSATSNVRSGAVADEYLVPQAGTAGGPPYLMCTWMSFVPVAFVGGAAKVVAPQSWNVQKVSRVYRREISIGPHHYIAAAVSILGQAHEASRFVLHSCLWATSRSSPCTA
jgi:hypothetical protein